MYKTNAVEAGVFIYQSFFKPKKEESWSQTIIQPNIAFTQRL